MELKITDDRVRDAAATCPVAKDVLSRLFPEAFQPPEPLYKRLGFKPGTRWSHDPHGIVYTYLGDTKALGSALGLCISIDYFYSLSSTGGFVFTGVKSEQLVLR